MPFFIACGDPHHGFARIYCDACGHDYLLAFSCKTRYFCPSCHQKRVLLYGEWVEENVLAPVPHRQYVFTLPRLVRHIFARRRIWLGELCRIAERLLSHSYAEALPRGRPALILFVQTFGDLINFNPHLHVLAADGAFLPDGRFVALPPVPGSLLAEGFRRAVLGFLVKNEALSEELRSRMLAWRHGGFSAHNEVRVVADDAEGRKKLAGYMLRAPMCLEKMTYDAATGTVIYRSKMHAGLKRNFQVMPGAAWLELLCKHIPDRYEHLVRYVGRYSNRARGERAKKVFTQARAALAVPGEEPVSESAARAKTAWARLIRKVYEADPLECPKCKGPMRVIALIDDSGVIRRILEHLGLWTPLPSERSPPVDPASWPPYASLPLTRFPTSPDLPHKENASEQPGRGTELALLWCLE
ncbi:MAG: transposase zinc-binding domain-containing protein [Betaproteobacteria bacterium]|nr:transposase zinc-binding domain-containing protein [Betaproteobacteria bacterium]